MNLVEEAILFATKAHEGQVRKMRSTPYILHPLEVASIIATVTDKHETIAAGVLHDTVEDCGVSPETIREKFGSRVYALVQSETEDKMSHRSAEDTWYERKRDSLIVLHHSSDIDVKTLWLADKLSNVRSFYREYMTRGHNIWKSLHQKDPSMQKWYYATIVNELELFEGTAAYLELKQLVGAMFKDIPDPDLPEQDEF